MLAGVVRVGKKHSPGRLIENGPMDQDLDPLLTAVLGATSVAVLIIASPSLASSFVEVVD